MHMLRNRADRGSMTVIGVALVMLAAVLLCTVAVAGRLMLCRSRTGTAADSMAIAAAMAYSEGATNPCVRADAVARHHDVRLVSCTLEGGDATVIAAMDTGLPVMRETTYESRAGPELCE